MNKIPETSAFQPKVLFRSGEIRMTGTIEKIFPLLCPKKEEEWIPGWKCETIHSSSGYNEEGAIFRTLKPYGTELYWTTLRYDMDQKIVDFLISAPRMFNFRFTIHLIPSGDGFDLFFDQKFTGVSGDGNLLIEKYSGDDFQARLSFLGKAGNYYLQNGRMIGGQQ